MEERLTYSLRHDEFTAAVQAVVNSIMETSIHRTWARRIKIFFWLYMLAGIALGTGVMVLLPTIWREVFAVVIILIIMHVGTMSLVGWMSKVQLGATYDARRHQDVAAVFDAEGAHYLGQEHQQTWRWPLLRRFHELPAVYVLEFIGFDMLVVPRRVFSSAEAGTRWATEMVSRAPAAKST